MSEISEFTPSRYLIEADEQRELTNRLAELDTIERSTAALFIANAVILDHFYEPAPQHRENLLPAAVACALTVTLLSGCASERASIQPQAETSRPTLSATSERSQTSLPTRTMEAASTTATPAPLSAETPEPTTVRNEVPEWARGLSFDDLRYAAENGGVAEDITASFKTPDGVAIEITSKPRALSDIRATEGNVNPYDFRRPDNAVLQNWDRETKKTVPVQTVHSANGYEGPLSGEGIRKWLEESGGIFGGARTSEEMLAQAESLVGTEVTFIQGDVTERGRIAMVLRADTNKLEEHMRVLHPDQSQYPNQYLTYDYLDFFEKSEYWKQSPDKDVVMYMFCGRDASDEKNNGRDRLETHRWIVVVEDID